MLPDGRVGFIDFGIVGRISPITWKAVEALISSMALADYETMVRDDWDVGCVVTHVPPLCFGLKPRGGGVGFETMTTRPWCAVTGTGCGVLFASVCAWEGEGSDVMCTVIL